jgi:hypothetical protein
MPQGRSEDGLAQARLFVPTDQGLIVPEEGSSQISWNFSR